MSNQPAKPKKNFISCIWNNGIKRFLCWAGSSIKEFVKDYYLNRNSKLFYNSIKICIVLFIFLFLLYCIKPQKSSIYSTFETDQLEIMQGEMVNLSMDTAYYSYSLNHAVLFQPSCIPYFTVDGETYSLHPTTGSFELTPTDMEGMICFVAENNEPCIHIQDAGSNFSSIKCIKNYELSDLPKPKWYDKDEKLGTELDINERNNALVFCNGSFSLYLYGYDISITKLIKWNETRDQILEQDVHLIYKATDQKYIKLDFPSGGKFVPMGIVVDENNKRIPTIRSSRIFSPKSSKIEISSIKTLATEKASGTIDVYYNPEPNKHEFMLQDLDIRSDNQTLSASIESTDNEHVSLTLSGYINKLTLSNNSLLPDFFNMFKDNAYLTPALLLSVIVGAITLTNKNKKEEKGTDKIDKESV